MGYLDDIIIYSRSEKEHLEHLEEIFARLKTAGLKLKLEKCCFFKKTHTISRTLNLGRQNPTLPEKLESIAKMPAPKNPKRSQTVPWISRILQEICPKIRRHFKGANASIEEGHRIQMDTRMQKLLPDLKVISTTSFNTPIPQPLSQLHTLHRCIKNTLTQAY